MPQHVGRAPSWRTRLPVPVAVGPAVPWAPVPPPLSTVLPGHPLRAGGLAPRTPPPPGWEVLHWAPCPPAVADGRRGGPQSRCAHVSKAPASRPPPLPGTPPGSKPFWTFVSLLTAHVCGGAGTALPRE